MAQSKRETLSSAAVQRFLRGRPGRRLLSLIAFCAVVPVAAFALMAGATPAGEVGRVLPLLPLFMLIGAVCAGLWQVHRRLGSLAELGAGTRRIAEGDFRTKVGVAEDGELAELSGALNTMSAQLDDRFRALELAAEIDRAILSAMDYPTIAQTVLDRLPQLYPCEGLSLTVLGLDGNGGATSWIELSCRQGLRSMVPAHLTTEDTAIMVAQPEWLLFGDGAAPVPHYLAHFDDGREVSLVACPLHHGGELLGVLTLRDNAARRSKQNLLELRKLADRMAVALSNARMMEQVRVLAFYDPLTRLPNRVLYKDRLGQAIGRARKLGRRIAACSLDLDYFGRVNDSLGHGQGDRLLQEVAERLQAWARREEAHTTQRAEVGTIEVARLSGDEFTVILPDLVEAEEAQWRARRLLDVFQKPFRLGGQEVFVTASLGVAVFPDDGSDPETLHKHADVAMSRGKEAGRNTVEPFTAAMNANSLGRMRLEQQLRRAVEREEFSLWYQPIVGLRTGWTTGAEALVRWEHPERGAVEPAEFIGLCEESGLIVPLGEWILRAVCRQLKEWERAGLGSLTVALNLSARQLQQRNIVRTIADILNETGVRPGSLSMELTESLLMEPGGGFERRLRELAELGITLAIDDFGTGYSSLAYLKNFPVSTLKIDRSFIEDVTTSADAEAITMAIIALAKAMDLEVVAEGVEKQEQVDFLRKRGCQKAQGYLLGRPARPADFLASLETRRLGSRASA